MVGTPRLLHWASANWRLDDRWHQVSERQNDFSSPRALQWGGGRIGSFPWLLQPRFLRAAHKTLMELKPPLEHVREYGKQAKLRVENAAGLPCQLPQPSGNELGPARSNRTVIEDHSTLEESQELREWYLVPYQRGKQACLEKKGDDAKLGEKDPSLYML